MTTTSTIPDFFSNNIVMSDKQCLTQVLLSLSCEYSVEDIKPEWHVTAHHVVDITTSSQSSMARHPFSDVHSRLTLLPIHGVVTISRSDAAAACGTLFPRVMIPKSDKIDTAKIIELETTTRFTPSRSRPLSLFLQLGEIDQHRRPWRRSVVFPADIGDRRQFYLPRRSWGLNRSLISVWS